MAVNESWNLLKADYKAIEEDVNRLYNEIALEEQRLYALDRIHRENLISHKKLKDRILLVMGKKDLDMDFKVKKGECKKLLNDIQVANKSLF